MKQIPRPASVFENRKLVIIGIVAIAVVVRIVFLILFYHTFYWVSIWSDSATYNQWARRIVLNHDWLGQDPFFMTPLYPYFLAVVYSFFGFEFLPVRVLQLLAGTGTVLGVFFIGEKLYSRRVGVIGAVIAAVYGPFLLSNNLILVETLKVFFIVLSVCLLIVAGDRNRRGWWLVSGIALGLAVLCRPTDALLLFAAALWLWSLPGLALKERLTRIGLVAAGVVLMVAPVTIRNAAVSGEFILVTSNGGLNFYLGNNPRAVGVYYNVDELDLANDPDGRVFAESLLKRTLQPSQVSSYYMQKAFDYITGEPLDFMRLLARKALLFFHRKEISQLGYNYQFIAVTSIPLLGTFPTFAVVGPLGIFGCIVGFRNRKKLALLYGALGAEFLSVILFFVTDRFRLSAMPFLIVFAGSGMVWLYDQWRSRDWKGLRVSALILLLSVLPVDVVNYGIPDEFSTEYEYVGLMYFDGKQYGNALGAYRESLHYRNTFHIHNNIGNVYLAMGNVKAALSEYSVGNALNPKQAISTFSEGTAYVSLQDWPSALASFNRAIDINPRFAPAYLNRGLTFYYMQKYPEALASLNQYVALERDRSKLGTVYQDIANLKAMIGTTTQ